MMSSEISAMHPNNRLRMINTLYAKDMILEKTNQNWNMYLAVPPKYNHYRHFRTLSTLEKPNVKSESKQHYQISNQKGKRTKLSLAFSIGVLSSLIGTSMVILPYPFNLIVSLAIGGPLSVSILAYRR